VEDPVRLAGIKPGDIVRVHDGLPYLAEVVGHDGARLRVTPITGPKGVRTVTSRDVLDHWRKTRSRQPSGALAGPSRGPGVATGSGLALEHFDQRGTRSTARHAHGL
jgi:hypothetical protein